MTFSEAMRRYGSDKPDLRIPLELVDVADLVQDCDFKVFAGPAKDPKGRVAALRVPGGGSMPRSQIDEYTAFVGRYGAKGLAYIKVNERAKGREGLQSPIVKFLSDAAVAGILERTGAQDNDLVFFGADSAKVVNDALGALRLKVGQDLKLVQEGWRPLWVVDFPMFEWDPEAKRWVAMHHPFTSPKNDDPAALRADPEGALAKAYDMVLNGSEIGGGSVRIHRQEMQSTVFDLLGIDAEEAQKKFGFLLDALKIRRASAWRHCLRPGPAGDADGGRRQHPRGHCLPEDADRCGSDDRCADGSQRSAAARAAHPCAHATAVLSAPLVFELVGEPNTTARVILRGRALRRGSAITEACLQLQVFGQIHIDRELTLAGRALLDRDEHPAARRSGRLRCWGRCSACRRPRRCS